MRTIPQHRILTTEEGLALADRIAAGDLSARNELVECNMRLVSKIAKLYPNPRLDEEEMVGEGYLGLIEAANRYRRGHGSKFSTYAFWWIRSFMFQGVHRGGMMRLPSNVHVMLLKVLRTRAILENETGKTPTEEDIAFHADLTVKEVKRCLAVNAMAFSGVSVDSPVSCDLNAATFGEIIPDPSVDVVAQISLGEESSRVIRLLEEFPPHPSFILKSIFGIGCDPLSLRDIGKSLGVSLQRIQQIRDKALRDLKLMLRTGCSFSQIPRKRKSSSRKLCPVPKRTLAPILALEGSSVRK